jgi:hypothetical protein
LYPPGNGGCGGKIQEKNSLLVHDPKLQTMIENHFFGFISFYYLFLMQMSLSEHENIY